MGQYKLYKLAAFVGWHAPTTATTRDGFRWVLHAEFVNLNRQWTSLALGTPPVDKNGRPSRRM